MPKTAPEAPAADRNAVVADHVECKGLSRLPAMPVIR